MCEAKPGPRCSAHALNELNAATFALNNAKTDMVGAEQNYDAAVVYHRQVNTPESAQLLKQWQTYMASLTKNTTVLHNKQRRAQFAYNSTPKGSQDLHYSVIENQNSSKTIHDGIMLDDGDWASVNYKEPANAQSTVYLEQGVLYRERQKDAAKQLSAAGNSLEKYAVVDSLLEKSRKQEAVIMDYLRTEAQKVPGLLENCVATRNSPETVAAFKKAKQNIRAAETAKTYAAMLISDLEQAKGNLPQFTTVHGN